MATRFALPGALAGMALGILAVDTQAGSMALLAALLAAVGAGLLVPLRRLAVAFACIGLAVGLALGGWRGSAAALPAGPGSVSGLVGRGELELVGTVVDDPRPRGSTQQVVLEEILGRTA